MKPAKLYLLLLILALSLSTFSTRSAHALSFVDSSRFQSANAAVVLSDHQTTSGSGEIAFLSDISLWASASGMDALGGGAFGHVEVSMDLTTVPEPGSGTLLGAGLLATGLRSRRARGRA